MKTIFKSILAFTVVMLLAANCTSDFEDLNTDPTKASIEDFDPNYLLTTSQLRYSGSADFSYETWRAQLIYTSTMVQHFSTVLGYWAGDKYSQNTAYLWSYWERAYDEQVKQVVDLVELSRGVPELNNMHQVARIMRVLIFHRITDLYGDVPYSEAGLGFYKRKFNPKFDTQQFIYEDMLKELDEASAALGSGTDASLTGDLIYSGNLDKWKRFANSLMLRLGMRLTKVDVGAAKTWAEQAFQGGLMQSIDDNAFIVHQGSGGRPTINRISQVLNLGDESTYVKWSKTFIDYLKNTNDPRLSVLASTTNAAGIFGQPNGKDLAGGAHDLSTAPDFDAGLGVASFAGPNLAILADNSGPTFFQTYAEVELLLAEAAERGWSVGADAQTHYNNGVRAAMEQLSQFNAAATVSDPEITGFLAANPYVPADGFEMINTQYWVATILNDYESFANWRRSGFPNLTPVNHPNGVTGGVIPRRFIYPTTESSVNGANLQEAVSRIPGGQDVITARVWWDQE